MFRFTIRDVLWLTALVAMGLAWWVDHRHTERWKHRANYLKDQINETKIEGKWMSPFLVEFDGDVIRMPGREFKRWQIENERTTPVPNH